MGGASLMPYDGYAEFWFETWEDWKELWTDAEFSKTLEGEVAGTRVTLHLANRAIGDNEHFVQQPLPMMAGYDYVYQDNTGGK